ncbi:hypothetical protein ACN077_25015 [Clostridium chromiireducens]|uniref:hypothetical protein n=1 Tax=Clostridium chromiireducens TaxID=225345 RepID=UPI003AF7DB2C
MENKQSQKLGFGIIIISIIYFISSIFVILGSLLLFATKNEVQTLSTSQIIISLTIQIVLTISIILILLKKSIGVYSYFTFVVINVIYTIIGNGFSWKIVGSLILPILMAILIKRKKELFSF